MCSTPKIPDPPKPYVAPPPPAKMAEVAENKTVKQRNARGRKRGQSSLTVRRNSVNTGSAGAGANISY